jgi:hypothetical protein
MSNIIWIKISPPFSSAKGQLSLSSNEGHNWWKKKKKKQLTTKHLEVSVHSFVGILIV